MKTVPNILTSLNLFTGCVGITLALSGNLHYSAFCIIIASILDFFDGFAAKILHAQSEFGKQLDSLADLVSFGILPASIIYIYILNGLSYNWLAYSAFLISVFSALRLAKFNIDKNQSEEFIGFPTPANALFIASLPIAIKHGSEEVFIYNIISNIVNSLPVLIFLILISSVLLISPIRMLSLKFITFSFKENRQRYLLIIFALIVLLIYGIISIPLIIIFYILLSLFNNIKINKR